MRNESAYLMNPRWAANKKTFISSLAQSLVCLSFLAITALAATRIWVPNFLSLSFMSPEEGPGLFRTGTIGRVQNLVFLAISGTFSYLVGHRLFTNRSDKRPLRGERQASTSNSGLTKPVVRNKRYGTIRVKSRIGSGGSSEVYLGETETGQKVAVKALRSSPTNTTEVADQLLRESEVLNRIQLGGVAQIVSEGLNDPEPWIAFEYIEGLSIRDYVDQFGPIDPEVLRPLAFRLFGLLSELHQQGVAHRDISPSNIILSQQGPILVDFGTARLDLEHAVTGSQLLVGTPGYFAPEVLDGRPVGTPADVFSLARVLYFCLNGDEPSAIAPEDFRVWGDAHGPALAQAADHNPRHRPQSQELAELLRCDMQPLEALQFKTRELTDLPRQVSLANQALSTAVAALVVSAVGISLIPSGQIKYVNSPRDTLQEADVTPKEALRPSSIIEDQPKNIDERPSSVPSAKKLVGDTVTGSLPMDTYSLSGGWFRSLPQPAGWQHSQLLPAEAFINYADGLDPRSVVEAHSFVLDSSEGPASYLAFVLSVDPASHGQATRSEDPKSSLLYSIFNDGLAEFGPYAVDGCLLEASEDHYLHDNSFFFVAVDLEPNCSGWNRFYLAGSFTEPHHSSNFRLEIFARSEQPISIPALLNKIKFRKGGVRPWSETSESQSFVHLAGWDETSAQQQVDETERGIFTAVIASPAVGQVDLESQLNDSTIYEFRIQYPGFTIPAGQWVPYNAAAVNSPYRYPFSDFPDRNRIEIPTLNRSDLMVGDEQPLDSLLIITAQSIDWWDVELTTNSLEPFWDRNPEIMHGSASAPKASIKLPQQQPAALGVRVTTFHNSFLDQSGAKVVQLTEGGVAQTAGIQVGEVILEFANEKINSTKDLTRAIGKYRPGDSVPVKLLAQEGTRRVAEVTLGEGVLNTAIGTGSITDELLDLQGFSDGTLRFEVRQEPSYRALMALPRVTRTTQNTADAYPSVQKIGPDGLQLEVSWLPSLRTGEINGDPYFEGSTQFISRRHRELGLSSELRLYFGESGPLFLGQETGGSTDLHWPIKNCIDIGAWWFFNRTNALKLELETFMDCEISDTRGVSKTHAPLFSFRLSNRFGDPLVMGDFIPADHDDLDHFLKLLKQLLQYMTPETFLPSEVIKSCENISSAIMILGRISRADNPGDAFESATGLMEEAAAIAADLASEDASWAGFHAVVDQIVTDFKFFDEPDLALYTSLSNQCGYPQP